MSSSSLNTFEDLPWDTDFLGFRVGRLRCHNLQLEKLSAVINSNEVVGSKLIYLVVNANDEITKATANRAGAWLADRKVTFIMDINPLDQRLTVHSAINSTIQWSPQLESLALQSGQYSRYRLDPRFDPSVFPRLYREWLHNSLSHKLAREVLVYKSGSPSSKDLGLLTMGIKGDNGDIGLLAVDESARGQKIGQHLVTVARSLTAGWGLNGLQVVTQLDNELACSFYRRCGFVEQQVEFIYHLWLE